MDTVERQMFRARRRAELRSPCFPIPHLQTDTSLHLGDGFIDDHTRKLARRQARAAGISPDGKIFMGQFADDRGYKDPGAWIDQADFRGSVRRRCHERGMGCNGTVNVPTPQLDADPLPPYRPDPKAVAKDVEQENQAHYDGRMTPAQKQERHEALTEQYTGL